MSLSFPFSNMTFTKARGNSVRFGVDSRKRARIPSLTTTLRAVPQRRRRAEVKGCQMAARRSALGCRSVSGLERPGQDAAVEMWWCWSVKCRQLRPSCSWVPLEELRLWQQPSRDDYCEGKSEERLTTLSKLHAILFLQIHLLLFFSDCSDFSECPSPTPPHCRTGIKMELSSPAGALLPPLSVTRGRGV